MTRERLNELLSAFRRARIAVLGDFCLDVYWAIDLAASEQSLETGKPTQPVRMQRLELGGAANVAANLRSLAVGATHALGIVGRDPFAATLRRLLRGLNIDTAGLLTQSADWQTGVFIKPHVGGEEQSRFDLGVFNYLSDRTRRRLVSALSHLIPHLDSLAVNQQTPVGLLADAFIADLNSLLAAHPTLPVVLDSRDLSGRFPNVVLKLNQYEALRLTSPSTSSGGLPSIDTLRTAAQTLHAQTSRPVFITCGDRGIIYAHQPVILSDVKHRDAATDGPSGRIPANPVPPPINPVGAGDAATAAIAAAMAIGASIPEAAELANLAAAVTVRMLDACGVATPTEMKMLREQERIP